MADLLDRLKAALADRYAIDREIGAGGMATVYLARDLKHDRNVALKILRPEIAAALGADRFLREIRTTAQLAHPHILPLHDSGAAEGFLYYTMPFVDGESLRERMTRERQLPLEDALAITKEVADALGYAHALGIVHRDIKPENILFQGGHAVVADFGIAKAVTTAGTTTVTEAGVAVGTPAYMSPEQAAGAPDVDGRTDIYSLGCVAFEMLVGEAPHAAPTLQAILARKLHEPMPSLRLVRSTVPAGVEAALRTALATVPADRHATAQRFAEALDRGSSERGVASELGAGIRRRRLPFAIAVPVFLLAAGWFMVVRTEEGSRIDSVVVLPLDNLTGDSAQAYFVDGMHEALTAELSQISALKVISRTSAMRYRGVGKSARQIAQDLGVNGLIEGAVFREGDQVRITVQLIHAPTDRRLWGRQFTRELRGILNLHTEVAQAIAQEIEAQVTPQEQVRLAAVRPVDPKAFELYLLGRHQWNLRTLGRSRDAVESLRSALRHDPTYAPAHAALGPVYLWLGEQGGMSQQEACTLAEAAISEASRLDTLLTEAHVAMAMWQLSCGWNWPAAEAEFRRALALNPGDAAVHQYYGRALARVTRRFDDALRELQRARELDPLSPTIRVYLGQHYLFARQYDAADEQLRAVLALYPDHALVLHTAGELALAQGRWADAVAPLERSLQQPGEQSSHYLAMVAVAYARTGQHEAAHAILDQLTQQANEGLASAFDMAALLVALGADDEALTWLERGHARRDVWLPEMVAWPWFDSLRSNPRYQELLRQMRLPW